MMRFAFAAAVLVLQTQPAPQPPPSTDIDLLDMPAGVESLRVAKPQPIGILASDIGRSIQRVPGRRAVSFVQKEGEGPETVPGSSDRDSAWTPDGTLLMSAGTRLFAWKAGDREWREVCDARPHGLGDVSRLSVAPDGKAPAIVVSASTTPRQ